jgi:hypothetical protein
LDDGGGQFGQGADDLGTAAGECVWVSCTDEPDEPRACGAGDVRIAPGVTDEDDLVSGEPDGSDPGNELHRLGVPRAPPID